MAEFNRNRSFVDLLGKLETKSPERTIVRFRGDDGQGVRDTSVGELAHRARSYANGLRDAGAKPGERVALLLSNNIDTVAFWFANGYAGTVEIPVNTELRGAVLRHVLEDSDPTLVIAEPDFVEFIEASGYGGKVLVWGPKLRARFEAAPAIEHADPEPTDLAAIMYTSGTTGPSKGVMLPHGYLANLGQFVSIVEPELSSEDVMYICTPLFHVDARLMMSAALNFSAALAIAPKFGASSFWPDVIDFNVSFFVFVGAMVAILTKTSTEEMMRGNRLRSSIGGPTPPEAYKFFEEERGIRLMEGFGMTECNGVTWSTPDKRRPGSVGWVSGPYDVRVIGKDGQQLPPGEVGEIVIRPTEPNLIALGYWKQLDATVNAFRDAWFHTGDLARFDEDGFMFFVGRAKEVVRRRGENVSTFEVETTMDAADGVLETAAVGVPDELGGEEEILLLVVVRKGESPDPRTLREYAEKNLARFAVPRYFRFVDDLPHTPTGKIAKHEIKTAIDEETHDLGGAPARR